ncbi:MAG: spondin domain-containing protein [Pseudomonadales bacterium]|nr:spondin domain-containing protein [Pseudomonadales bacterium]
MPGETVMLSITAPKAVFRRSQLSLAAMLLPTNDTFISLNGVKLPREGQVSYLAHAYDAGSEPNNESCADIPGPSCGGAGYSPEVTGEGFVYPSPGIHGENELSVEQYAWSGPVAKVTIKRIN